MSTINPVTTPPPFINRPRETLLVRAEATIQALPEQVFAVITDTASYPQWNSFVRSVAFVQGSSIDQAGAVFDLSVDQPFTLLLDGAPVRNQFVAVVEGETSTGYDPYPLRSMSRLEKRLVYEFVSLVGPDGQEIPFGNAEQLGNPQRHQVVQDLGDGKTRYFTFEDYTGISPLLAPVTPLFRTELGLKAFAEDLKCEVERRINAGTL